MPKKIDDDDYVGRLPEGDPVVRQALNAQILLESGFPPEVVGPILVAAALREMSFGGGGGPVRAYKGPLEAISMALNGLAEE